MNEHPDLVEPPPPGIEWRLTMHLLSEDYGYALYEHPEQPRLCLHVYTPRHQGKHGDLWGKSEISYSVGEQEFYEYRRALRFARSEAAA